MRLPDGALQIASNLAAARLGRRTPLKVTHLLTYACNVECGFCTRIHIPSESMPAEQVMSMMSSFAALGTRWWVFNGGEPTLVPELGQYIAHAQELGFHSSMVTNGSRIEARISELQALDFVICSIHGDEEEHDRIVGRKGAYRAALSGLSLLKEAGVELCLLCVLNEHNHTLAEAILELGEELGAGVAFQPIVETRLGGAEVDPSLLPSTRDLSNTIDWILEQKVAGRPISSSTSYLEAIRTAWPNQPIGVKCRAGQLFCEVTPEGYVVPCCSEEEYTFPRCHGPSVGWEPAFLALPDRSSCQACWFKGPQELNLLLSGQPGHTKRALVNLATGRFLWD